MQVVCFSLSVWGPTDAGCLFLPQCMGTNNLMQVVCFPSVYGDKQLMQVVCFPYTEGETNNLHQSRSPYTEGDLD